MVPDIPETENPRRERRRIPPARKDGALALVGGAGDGEGRGREGEGEEDS